ncbi:MAG: uridine diphosphate-N-acetylglucosamine-binding protein YvcK [Actinomycetota bacterium]|nr:uridine diphosphate-N-acetylglucosamine-binding protein YvcK [Actinomycetota bacterium]
MTRGLKAVALGGGHGLYATLLALRAITDHVTAVVTVADDGGSSGRLRRELDVLPPGDLRMALTALAADDGAGARWRQVFQHRFGGTGALAGHAVGNLVMAGLLEVLGDPVMMLDEACRLLGVTGRVLPMTVEPLDIEADVAGLDSDPGVLRRIRGQVAVATTPGRVQRVWLRPERPRACVEAVRAVGEADLVVLGPGSWFTSVLPHLLVPDLAQALTTTVAHRILVLNLVPQPGETAGFSPEQHLTVLRDHAPSGFTVQAVLADADTVAVPARLHRCAEVLGGHAYLDRVADNGSADRHDPVALAAALRRILRPAGRVEASALRPASRVEASALRPAGRVEASALRPADKPHLQGEEMHRWP